MKKSIRLIHVLLAFLSIKTSYAQSDNQKIGSFIASINHISIANPSASEKGDVLGPPTSSFEGSGLTRKEISTEKRRFTRTLEKFVAFNPNADALYPCSLVQGKSLKDGILSPISTSRSPSTITVTDLVSQKSSDSLSRKVSDPSHGNVVDAIRSIINQSLDADQPAKLTYLETSVNSVDEGFVKLGASAKWATGNISGSLNIESAQKKTKLMVRFVQSYYTVSCEPPSHPSSYFSSDARFADFRYYAGDDNPPAYISSVSYGRELWLLVESSDESAKVKAALSFAFSSGFAGADANVNAERQKVLNESSMQILILGGSGRPAIEVITGDRVSKLKEYLLAGANFSKTNPGAIISYTARYLRDNSVFRISSFGDYDISTPKDSPEPDYVQSMTVTWTTPEGKKGSDDKDWNTQAIAMAIIGGAVVADVSCCSADRATDHWEEGSSETRPLRLLRDGLKYEDFKTGVFSSKCRPKGGDNWLYTAVLTINFKYHEPRTISCEGKCSCSTRW